MNSDSTTYISSAVTGCHTFTLDCLEKILPLKFWTAQLSDCFQSQFSAQCSYQKLFKYIYSVSQTLNTVLVSTNSTINFSLSDVIVHILPQKIIITHAVSPTTVIANVQVYSASFFSPKSVSLLSSVSKYSLSYSLKVSFLVKRKPFLQPSYATTGWPVKWICCRYEVESGHGK